MKREKLLLHTCCACCVCVIAKRLSENYEVTLFAFNPNIHPQAEYAKRLDDVKQVAENLGIEVIEDEYDPQEWLKEVKGFENEPEGGARCEICFRVRLERTAQYAKEHGFDAFASTITTGRNKKATVVNPIGMKASEKFDVSFLAENFKKNRGLDDSIIECDNLGIVRQDYCGCVFSRRRIEVISKSNL